MGDNEYLLVDDSVFDQFGNDFNSQGNDITVAHNCCDRCGTVMKLYQTGYQCPECCLLKPTIEHTNHDDVSNGTIKVNNGSRNRIYNINNDYTKTQRKFIFDQLVKNNSLYQNTNSRTISRDILKQAADDYNAVQKLIVEDPKDGSCDKKFVRRGTIKDEVLAAFVYFACIKSKASRMKKDIAAFMQLPTQGFSRGEDIVRILHAQGKIDIPVDEELAEDFADRYLEALNLEKEGYKAFIMELVDESERLCIGMNRQISSKVVGAIWILITQLKLNITSVELEKAADGTKKNTFVKFQKDIQEDISKFEPIFKRHNIPHQRAKTTKTVY